MGRPRLIPLLFTIGVAALLLPTSATAGAWEHERDGVTFGFNLGGGSAGLEIRNAIELDRQTGGGASIRVGYAFHPEWAIGFESNAWAKEVDDEWWRFSVAALGISYFPNSGGFFMRAGIGSGAITAKNREGDVTTQVDEDGVGFLGALGYEWRLTRTFALGPQVDFGYLDVGEGVSANYFNITAGFNWYL
jgi:hypothetical protein